MDGVSELGLAHGLGQAFKLVPGQGPPLAGLLEAFDHAARVA